MSGLNTKKVDRCYYCKKEEEIEFMGVYVVSEDDDTTVRVCMPCREEYGLEGITEEQRRNYYLRGLTPKKVYNHLDEYVVGQDRAKKVLAVEVWNHMTRVYNNQKLETGKLKKNNILITGPSGTGKTLLAEHLADILGVPFIITSATSVTESGYVGSDVESMLSALLMKANGDVELAQKGIVFIDEVDKIAKKSDGASVTRDVSGEGVQQALLKMVEGTVVGVPENGGRVHPNQKLIDIDTSDILFICGGAFVGIEDIVKERTKSKDSESRVIGFGASIPSSKKDVVDKGDLRKKIDVEDLQKFGMIPEFLGRFPVVCNLNALTKEDLKHILSLKTGVLEEYIRLFEVHQKELKFTDECLDLIVDLAMKREVGARGIRGIVSTFMIDVQFDICESEEKVFTITADMIRDFYSLKDEFEVESEEVSEIEEAV